MDKLVDDCNFSDSDEGSIPSISTTSPCTVWYMATLGAQHTSKWCPQRSSKSEVGQCFIHFIWMFYSYILKLSNNTYYSGFSSNLKIRIDKHIHGEVRQTKNLRPLKLVYYCAFVSKKKALDFEKYLKTPSGFAFRNKHLIWKTKKLSSKRLSPIPFFPQKVGQNINNLNKN